MKSGPYIFKKTPLALSMAGILTALTMPAQAVTWEDGNLTVTLDSNFTLGTSIRVEERDTNLIGKSNLPQFDWSGYNAATNPLYIASDIWATPEGGYSANGDLGNLNFDKGEAFSTIFRGLHELKVEYENFGLFVRGLYFYDFELKDNDRDFVNPITGLSQDPCDTANDWLCADARFLDAFVYTNFYVGDMPVTLRLGDQVVSWGESTFIQHGINTTNPVDVNLANVPGAELREIFVPVGMLYGSIELNQNFSIDAYYQYEWERSILPQAGSYFATNDFVGEGGQANNIQLNFTSNPDANLDYLLAAMNQIGAGLNAGASAQDMTGLLLAHAARYAVRGYSDAAHDDAPDSGQYGIKMTYFSEELNETEFSFYHINYHSQRPLISGETSNFTQAGVANDLAYIARNTITRDNITNIDAFTEARFVYPEDIKLYGFSFNTNIGETALAGEIAYRQDEPLQIDDVELLYVGTAEQIARSDIAGFGRTDLLGISQLNNIDRVVGPGETADGFILSDTMQIQATATHIFGPALGTDNLIVVGEVGYVDISDFPDPSVLRLNSAGTARTASLEPLVDEAGNVISTREGLHTGISNGPETNPFATDDAWGYRVAVVADFNSIYAGMNLRVRTTFSHDVDGITPDPLFLFQEDRKSANISFTLDYLSRWSASASYNAFWGGVGTTNRLADRDFISFNIKYAI